MRWNRMIVAALSVFGLLGGAQAQTIDTYAGGGMYVDRPALSISLHRPHSIAVGPDGRVHVTNFLFPKIDRLDPSTGLVTTVAGNGVDGYSGDGGPAVRATISSSDDVALDGAGNLFIAEQGNRVRKVAAADGRISTYAGSGHYGFSGDGGLATSASLGGPLKLAVDGAGNLYILDAGVRVRRVDAASGVIVTVAGNGTHAYSGDGGPATSASINARDVAIDAAGNLFLAESGDDQGLGRLRRIDAATGEITTVAGNGAAPGFDTPMGPDSIALDGHGGVVYVDHSGSQVNRFELATGLVTVIAGYGDSIGGFTGDGGPAVGAQIQAVDVAVDVNGDLYLTSSMINRVRKVSAGIITTAIGSGEFDFSGDGGPATQADLGEPWGLATDAAGNLFIADLGADDHSGEVSTQRRVRKVSAATGVISTVAGDGSGPYSGDGGLATDTGLNSPLSVSVDSTGNVYLADYPAIRRISAAGIITTVPGVSGAGVAVDGADNLYVANLDDCVVRKVAASDGDVSVVAGDGGCGYSGDGGLATGARFGSLRSIAVDAAGNIFIADNDNLLIRRVDAASGIVTAISASGGQAAVAVDRAGNLYVSDMDAYTIRAVSMTGTSTVIAGTGTLGYSGDGGPAASANIFGSTFGIAVDDAGNLYFSSAGSRRVRRVSGLPVPPGDATPPLIEPEVTGTLGANGWYTSDVTMSWAVTDAESSITSATDCDTSTVLADSADAEFTCSATSAGGTSSETVHVHRDATPPGATASASPFPNANGWNSGDVTVHIAGTDATSGIASCTADQLLTAEGVGQSAFGACTDVAGNVSGTVSVNGISIDKTPPLVSASAVPAPGGSGWNTSAVTVSFSAIDALSGVPVGGCDAPIVLSGSGAAQSATGSCADNAGNAGFATASGIDIDLAAPVASASAAPGPNANGWNNTDVMVTFSGTDALSGSGIASCSSPLTLSAEGAGLSASGTCSDLAGNTSGAATATANIDKTPPAANVVVPANFGSYVQGSSLTASFGCTDALSGVVSCAGSVGNGAAIDTSSAGARVFNATATDAAGNAGTASHTFEIAAVDATLPVSGGSVADVDPETGVTTTLSVPAGVLSQPTQVAVSVQEVPPDVPLPPGIVAPGSYFVSVDLNPVPTYPLPAPGITITLPLTSPALPGAPLALYSYDSVQNQLVAVLDTSGQPIVGTVNADGLSATFAGVSHFSMVVALEPPAAVPVITPLLSGTLGANGWYTSNVSLSWSIVSSTTVSSRTGCDPRTVSINTGSAGLTYTCTATNAVGTSSGSVTIRKDATAPVSVALPSPLPNLAGWWKSPVTVTFSGVDLQSGIASCTTPVVLSLEGAGQGASGQCTNNAGLASALAALSGIRIDLTAPGISITLPANGAVYRRNATVRASYACTDALSGIATCLGTVPNGSRISTSTRGTKTFKVTAVDKAGNTRQTSHTYTVQ